MRLKRDDSSDSLLNYGPRSEYVKKYPEHPVQKTSSYKPSPGNYISDQPLDSLTTQRKDYPEHQLEKRQPFRPVNERPDFGAFEGHRSYREDYPEWKLPPRHNKHKESWNPPEQPFVGKSTIMTDYPEHQVSPRINYKPEHKPLQSDAPFYERTGYLDTYTEHPVQRRQQREKPEWQRPTEPIDSTTTQKKDYLGLTQPRQKSFKPSQETMSSDAPLESDTTMATSFKPHEMQRPYKHEHEPYIPPDGAMDMNTTTGTYYKEHPLDRPTYHKPESSNILKRTGEMVKETNYSNTFQQPPPVKRELVKRRDFYQPPSVPLESTSTAHQAYKEHEVQPRRSFKPSGEYVKPEGPFVASTDYTDRFKQHSLPPRYVMQREAHKPPSAPFDSRTTTNDSYIGAYQAKREAFRPDREAFKSDQPLESGTTFGSSFKPWPTEKRQMIRPNEYTKPEGQMDLTTINRETYKEVRGERPAMRKLGDSSLLSMAGRFEDKTSYTSDFVPKRNDFRKLVKPDNQYVPPSIPFDNKTTYRASHVGHNTGPRERGCRPDALSDVLGQRDKSNPFHIRTNDWRDMDTMPQTETVSG